MNELEQMMNEITNDTAKKEPETIDLSEKVQEFLINRDEEETQMTLDFARAILNIELQIKELKEDIKNVKTDAKANGVSVGKVMKVLNNLKKAAKEKSIDVLEMESIESVLSHDVDVKMMIANLINK